MSSTQLLQKFGERESMDYDVVIVGGGPAGLSAAIHLKQLAQQHQFDLSVCVLEKGSEIGAHIVSGAVMDPRAINELIPDWKAKNAPISTHVTEDRFYFLSQQKAFQVPHWALPNIFKNQGNYIVSLANVCRWLAQQAETLDVDIFPGFAATEVLFDENGRVKGVATGNMGLDKTGQPTEHFQLGMALHAKYTLFCEGARGSLGRQLIKRFQLDQSSQPQNYGLGIKEIWQVDPTQHQAGLVIHTAGWPLSKETYGGSFLYHMENHQIAVGFVVGLGYQNPYLSPFEEFQRYKTHPFIRRFFENGQRISYGARALTSGGLFSLPKLSFPGGALVGDNAGFLNAARIKGSHAAIKSGMLAAQSVFSALQQNPSNDVLASYSTAFNHSWLYQELYRTRNFKQWMNKGLYLGTLMVGIEQKLFNGAAPWNLTHQQADYAKLKPAKDYQKIVYPKPDNKLTFDRLSSVFLTHLYHAENQPCHLTLKDPTLAIKVNWEVYAGPESRYCPAGVYEFVENEQKQTQFVINAQNCIHCKTCDIKDPSQNIVWIPPEGGSGPNYSNM